MPFFSIVLPTFNRAHLIGVPIRSIISQTFNDWELIVIDDGSTDNTKEVVAGFNDERIKYIYQNNQERSAARNHGIKNAAGKFICFIDSDDLWYINHLQLINLEIVEKSYKPALYFTSMRWVFENRTQDVIFKSPQQRNPVEYVIENQIAPSTACLHADITERVRFNTLLHINEDVEFFARVAAKYDLVQITQVTIDLNVHEENTKGRTQNYITPQIEAMKLIFANDDLKDLISRTFKKKTFKGLRHQLINHFNNTGQYVLMNKEIICFLLLYPFARGNKTKWVLLLYHLPGGQLLKLLVQKLKRA
jgi:glycosyltransferase involved in cell wall biosynthesis